jgi:hypothetical protein
MADDAAGPIVEFRIELVSFEEARRKVTELISR